MTTSSTSCSTSQSARPRRSAGVVPTFWRSKWKSPSTSTSATTTASIFLWTSIPAIRYGIGLSCGSGERASSHQSGSRAIAGAVQGPTTLNYSVNHARSGSNSCSASLAPLANLDLAAPRRHSVESDDFHSFSRASRPSRTSCGNRPEHPARLIRPAASFVG